jgi:hypothetical protein
LLLPSAIFPFLLRIKNFICIKFTRERVSFSAQKKCAMPRKHLLTLEQKKVSHQLSISCEILSALTRLKEGDENQATGGWISQTAFRIRGKSQLSSLIAPVFPRTYFRTHKKNSINDALGCE